MGPLVEGVKDDLVTAEETDEPSALKCLARAWFQQDEAFERLRSRMTNKTLDCLLSITINGPKLYTPESDKLMRTCVEEWLRKKCLRKLPRNFAISATASHLGTEPEDCQ